MELHYPLSHKPIFQLLLYILLLMSQSYRITILPNMVTAFIVTETWITSAYLCTDPLPQDPTPFQPSVTTGSHSLPWGPTGEGEGAHAAGGVGAGWLSMIPKYALTKLDQALHLQLLASVAGSTCGHLWALQMWSATASPYFSNLWSRNPVGVSVEYFLIHLAMILSSCHWFPPDNVFLS